MHNNKLVSNMNINNNIKTPEQQIDEAVAFFRAFLIPNAKNKQEADDISRRLDSIEHELKAIMALVNDKDLFKAALHKFLSQKR